MATTQKLLGEAVGIQFTGTRDETGTNPILGLTDGLIVGQFRRGRTDKPMRITQQNIRAELGYEPNNKFYQAVQAVLDQLPFVWVLRLGSAGVDNGGGGNGGGSNGGIPSNEMHFTTLAGSVDYVGTQGDRILLSDNSVIDITATGGKFTFNAPSGKHIVKLVESVGRGNYVSVGGGALVELHNFPTLSTVTKFNFAGSIFNPLPNLTKVPDFFPSNITNVEYLFSEATNFNQPLNNWNVSNVTNMSYMFAYTTSFNQDLNNWNVSNVTNMRYMFNNVTSFNQPLNNWNVSNVTDMFGMFYDATSFNQPLNNWNVSNVTNMSYMFNNVTSFNQDLNNWNVSNVTDMYGMFYDATSFNQPLNNWNVSNVTDMYGMFYNATSFNQDLSMWCMSNIPTTPVEFDTGATNWTLPRPVWGTCPAP